MPKTYKDAHINYINRLRELSKEPLNEEKLKNFEVEAKNFEEEYGEIRSLENELFISSVLIASPQKVIDTAMKLLMKYIEKFGDTPKAIGSYLADAISVLFPNEPNYYWAEKYVDTPRYEEDYARYSRKWEKSWIEINRYRLSSDSDNPVVRFVREGDPTNDLVNLMRVESIQEMLLIKLLALIKRDMLSGKYMAGICAAADNLEREGKYNTLLILRNVIDAIKKYRNGIIGLGLKDKLYLSLMHFESILPFEQIKEALESGNTYDKLRKYVEKKIIKAAKKAIEMYEKGNKSIHIAPLLDPLLFPKEITLEVAKAYGKTLAREKNYPDALWVLADVSPLTDEQKTIIAEQVIRELTKEKSRKSYETLLRILSLYGTPDEVKNSKLVKKYVYNNLCGVLKTLNDSKIRTSNLPSYILNAHEAYRRGEICKE
jgi:hypothetical protein